MFRIEWFDKNGDWFSTSYVQGAYGFIGRNISKIQKEIQSGLSWWKSSVTWKVFYEDQDVTEEYISQVSSNNPHKIDYGMI